MIYGNIFLDTKKNNVICEASYDPSHPENEYSISNIEYPYVFNDTDYKKLVQLLTTIVRDQSSIVSMIHKKSDKLSASNILFDFSKCKETDIIKSFDSKYFHTAFQDLIYNNSFAASNNCMVQVTFKSEGEAMKYFVNKYKSIENIENIAKEVENLFDQLSDKFHSIDKAMEKLRKDNSLDKNKRKLVEGIEKASNNLSNYIYKYYADGFYEDYMDTVGKLFKYFTRKSKE